MPITNRLTPSEPDRAGHEHQSPVARRHGVRETHQLLGGQRGTLGLPHWRQTERAGSDWRAGQEVAVDGDRTA